MEFDFETLVRFLLAIIWGSLVGAEREYHSKAAGFRTTIMISFGACFFAIMSQSIGGSANPDRIAANIVTGIGFLGAGVIFKADNRINGVTTAATIWAVAAVGLGIGCGYYFAAASGSILILFVLAVLPSAEEFIDGLNQTKQLVIQFDVSIELVQECETLLGRHDLKYRLTRTVKEDGKMKISWRVQGKSVCYQAFTKDLQQLAAVSSFEL